jgi:preprotein translocase subunit SecY
MLQKRYFSTKNDFKTGFLSKFLLFLGILLLIVYIILKIITLFVDEKSTGFLNQLYNFAQSSSTDSILAFSIILIAISIIFYFFHIQFAKLEKIADEIESKECFEDDD